MNNKQEMQCPQLKAKSRSINMPVDQKDEKNGD